MSSKSDYFEDLILNTMRAGSISTQTPYAALYTAAPSDAGGGTQVSGNAYARQAVTFGAPSGGVMLNSALVTFPTPTPSGWGTITHFGIFDAATAGNLLYWGPLSQSEVVGAGNVVTIAIGALSVSES